MGWGNKVGAEVGGIGPSGTPMQNQNTTQIHTHNYCVNATNSERYRCADRRMYKHDGTWTQFTVQITKKTYLC